MLVFLLACASPTSTAPVGVDDSGTATTTEDPGFTPTFFMAAEGAWAQQGAQLQGFEEAEGPVAPHLRLRFYTTAYLGSGDPAERCDWEGEVKEAAVAAAEDEDVWQAWSLSFGETTTDCPTLMGSSGVLDLSTALEAGPLPLALGRIPPQIESEIAAFFTSNGLDWVEIQPLIFAFFLADQGGEWRLGGYGFSAALDAEGRVIQEGDGLLLQETAGAVTDGALHLYGYTDQSLAVLWASEGSGER